MTLEQIEARIPKLTAAYQKVARVIVRQPNDVVRWSIRELAQKADVSEPTVLRFCRLLGSDGYQDFKIRLAQGLAAAHPYGYAKFESDDSTADIATKVFDTLLGKLGAIRNSLNIDALEAATKALGDADRIEFYGLGISGRVATDAYHKFYRLGRKCIAYTDVEMLHLSARSLTPKDAVVVISNSGETRELLLATQAAKRSGATTIAVTGAGTSLAHLAAITVPVDPLELGSIHSPLISRVAHLLVLDILALGLMSSGAGVVA